MAIRSKSSTEAYRDGWDKIFGKKKMTYEEFKALQDLKGSSEEIEKACQAAYKKYLKE